MHLHCQCGTNQVDSPANLETLGWKRVFAAKTNWLCPTCVEARSSMPTVPEARLEPSGMAVRIL